MTKEYLKNYDIPTNSIPREKALEKAMEYFGSKMESGVFLDKYALKKGDGTLFEATPLDMHKRIAKQLARIESNYPNPRSYEEILESIKDFKYLIPQGSPMSGIGNPFQILSISNCFVRGNESDSYGGIMKTDEQLAHLMKRRAGVGTDISHLRPAGTVVRNAARTSTGAVSFMERYSNTTREVAQSGRRGALMLTMSGLHPDVEKFVDIKMDKTKVTGANISLRQFDEFIEAVKRGDDTFKLRFPADAKPEDATFIKEVNPVRLWNKIVVNAWSRAEPGLLFWDTILKESIPDCYADLGFKTISTNPSMRGDTLVATKNGAIPIKELAEDFQDIEVINYRGEWQPAIAVKSGSNQELQKIVFKNGLESYCTKEHKWPVLSHSVDVEHGRSGDLKKKTTSELESGDKIYLPSFSKPINNINALLDRNDGMLAMSRNSGESLPQDIWRSNHDYVSGALDICLRAYGTVQITDNLNTTAIRFLIESEGLANDIRKLLHLYGVRSTLGEGRQGDKHLIQITGMYAHKFAEAFRVDSKMFAAQLRQVKEKDTSSYKTPRHYLTVDEVIATDKFEDVYDLTVYDDTNTFLTEFGITGNCGEITLCDGDSCRLLATNLYSYVVNPFQEDAHLDWELFKEKIILGQRLMDDMVDIEIEHVDAIIQKIKDDPEPEEIKRTEIELWEKIKDKAVRGRRTGFGITAMGDMLAALGYRYGSKEATDFADKLMRFKKHYEYESSSVLAQERGTFPIWDPKREEDNPFLLRIKDEKPELYQKLITHGRRNISLSTIAPTGTVSLLAKTSSGIENVFSCVYFRKKKVNPNDADVRVDFVDKVGDSWQEYPVFHHHFETFLKVAKGMDEEQILNLSKEEVDELIKQSPYYKAMSNDVDWVEKVRMQGRIQKHIDHSISVTVNLPEDIPVETVNDVYMTAWETGCKGVTVYRDNCRSGVLTTSSEKDKEGKIIHNDAPKRPKSLQGDVYHATAIGERWTVIVGLIGEDPYEVFSVKGAIGRHKDRVDIKRVKRGHYNLEKDDDVVAEDFLSGNTEEENSIARLISTSLRHGAKIDFVVEQLNKTEGSIVSFSKAIARTLKRYITDEDRQLEVAKKESLQNCPDDGQECELVHLEGCVTCLTHGVSKCT